MVTVRPFTLSADPRERDLDNPLLLTGNADYDVVWAIDADYEVARSLPCKTLLPRPTVGHAGLLAEAWATRLSASARRNSAAVFRAQQVAR